MNTHISAKDWLQAFVETTEEVSSQSLGLPAIVENTSHDGGMALPPGSCGSFISMVQDGDAIQLGLITDKDGLSAMAKSMLGMTPEDDLPETDVVDAVGEIINIVAGGVKKRLSQTENPIKLGLPMFVRGEIEQGKAQETSIAALKIGPTTAHLMVLKKREDGVVS